MANLVINNGSTSFRFTVFDGNKKILEGKIENINMGKSYYKLSYNQNEIKKDYEIHNINEAINLMKNILDYYSLRKSIHAIGIRIVSGANEFSEASILNEENIKKIKRLKNFMPLHFDVILETINKCLEFNIPIVGVFDNTFHNTIPKENYLYGIPYEYYLKYGIRKYGYHGLSYSSIVSKYNRENMNSVICHLGGGSSICNIKNSKSFDTTMGFSPNSGLMMSSRSGDIDSSIVFYLYELGYQIEDIRKILNSESGYQGILKISDAKKIVDESLLGNERAILLRKMINLDFKKHLLGMMSINKPNEIIITGGMGCKNKEQREMLFSNLEDFNIEIDKDKNNSIWDSDGLISTNNSIPIYVMVDDEEKEINKECNKVLRKCYR